MGGDDEREPGAHARHRHARVVARRGGHLRQVGGAGHRHRHRHRAGPRRRRPAAHPRGLDGPVLADVPAASLSDDAPLYDRPRHAPARRPAGAPALAPPAAADCAADLLALLRSARWVYRQYDHQLFLNTVAGPGAMRRCSGWPDPGCPPSARGVAVTTDSNPRACALDPRAGTALVVAEGVANLACVGADAGRGGQLPQLRQPGAPRGDVAALGVHRRDGRGLPRPVAAGDRGQRQPLQRERRGRHRPDAGARRARPRRRGADAAARARRGRRATPSCCWARGRGGRVVPAGGDALGHRAPGPPQRRPCPAVDFDGARGVCAFVAGLVAVRWARRVLEPASAPSTTCRAAAWPWPWPRWRPPAGDRVRAGGGWTRPSCSPSCRRASWWPRPHPDRAVRPGRGRRGSRPPCSAGPEASGCASGTLVDIAVEALVEAYEERTWPVRWAIRDAARLCENGARGEGSVRCLRGLRARDRGWPTSPSTGSSPCSTGARSRPAWR